MCSSDLHDHSDDEKEEEEEWEDLEYESDVEPEVAEYRLSANRRSSIDLKATVNDLDMSDQSFGGSNSSLQYSTSMMDASADLHNSLTEGGLIVDFEPNKRLRSRKPRVSSIHEGMENESNDELEIVDDDEMSSKDEAERDSSKVHELV